MDLLVEHSADTEIRTAVAADGPLLREALGDTDVLIGADGLRSDVRTTFFAERTRPRYSGLVGWRGVVDFESGGYGETWGDGALFGNTPIEAGRTNFYAAVRAPEDDRAGAAELRKRFAGWRTPIPQILDAVHDDELLHNPIYDLHPPLGSFVSDRVALLGDAAHAMTPHAGRGACEAMLDARALVRHLTKDVDVATALRHYDRDRRRPAQRSAARSWRLGRVAHARGASAALRNAAARAAGLLVR
jgi:2-polyprenyl-6-methoxyphenol hydroxylase-like FAD-dependent oxidoreductase